eukprot:scaffold157035_cov37-Attheya_sp.AAC.1
MSSDAVMAAKSKLPFELSTNSNSKNNWSGKLPLACGILKLRILERKNPQSGSSLALRRTGRTWHDGRSYLQYNQNLL